MRHGDPVGPIVLPEEGADDPYIFLVNADMSTWVASHPCECEGLCICPEYEE